MTAPSTTSSTAPDGSRVEPKAGVFERGAAHAARALDSAPTALFVALALASAGAIVAQSWIAEDAFITYRSLDHFVGGHGLRWNVDERVQTYTHPLWALLHVPVFALVGSWTNASFLLSLGCLLGVYFAAQRLGLGEARRFSLLFLLPFALSPALRVYAISGLENPLVMWMLVAFAALLLGERGNRDEAPPWNALAGVTAIAALTRLDTLLLFAPAWLLLLHRRGLREGARGLAWVALPLLAWEAFSLFYYGFPFPNTKYAKLDTGVASAELLVRGLQHVRELFYREPQTLLFGASGLFLAARWAARTRREPDVAPRERAQSERALALACGAASYLAYATTIGGGFMQGRFFSAPLWLGLVLAAFLLRHAPTRVWLPLPAAGLALAGFAALVMAQSPGITGYNGVVDEQAAFAETNMLWTQWRGVPGRQFADNELARDGLALRDTHATHSGAAPEPVRFGAAGLFGYYAGPSMIGVDVHGLCDPLLARLPMSAERLATGNWRTGHFVREVPEGYMEARRSGDTRAMDPDLAAYYAHLRHVTRGPLFSTERLLEVVRFNLGVYEPLRARYIARTHGLAAAGAAPPATHFASGNH